MSLRDGIVSAGSERMAAGDPRGSHPSALGPSVPLDRLIGVVRAGRVVAAGGRQDPGDGELITANQQQEKLRHGLTVARLSAASEASAFRSANETSSAAGRAIRTTSYRIPTWRSGESIPSSASLPTSRSRRRARLRCTEVLTARLTVTPTRHWLSELGTANPTRARPE